MDYDKPIWENRDFYLLRHESSLPWVKLFTRFKYREMTELPFDLKMELFGLLETIESEMIDYYNPETINLASFGNQLPHLHWHIIARFKNDPWFPKSVWEEAENKPFAQLPSFENFANILSNSLG